LRIANCQNFELFSSPTITAVNHNHSYYSYRFVIRNHLGAILSRNNEMIAKMKLGIQMAINGATEPLVANVVEICMNKI